MYQALFLNQWVVDASVNKIDKVPAFMELTFQWKDTDNNKDTPISQAKVNNAELESESAGCSFRNGLTHNTTIYKTDN